jgi:hypothetical protein
MNPSTQLISIITNMKKRDNKSNCCDNYKLDIISTLKALHRQDVIFLNPQ